MIHDKRATWGPAGTGEAESLRSRPSSDMIHDRRAGVGPRERAIEKGNHHAVVLGGTECRDDDSGGLRRADFPGDARAADLLKQARTALGGDARLAQVTGLSCAGTYSRREMGDRR